MSSQSAALIDAGGVLTFADAARELQVSRQRVSQMVREGKLGTMLRFGRVYVTAYTVRRERKAREDEGLIVHTREE